MEVVSGRMTVDRSMNMKEKILKAELEIQIAMGGLFQCVQ